MPLPLANRTIDSTYDAAVAAFTTHMTAQSPASQLAYENDGFDPETAFDTVDPQLDQWVRFSMGHVSGGGQAAVGVPLFRRGGVCIVQCFVRVNTGRLLANTQADIVLKFFETRPVGAGIWFRNASPVEAGDDGAWYQINVSAEFIWDTLRT